MLVHHLNKFNVLTVATLTSSRGGEESLIHDTCANHDDDHMASVVNTIMHDGGRGATGADAGTQ